MQLIVIHVEQTTEVSEWIKILNKLFEDQYPAYAFYEILDNKDGQIVHTGKYSILIYVFTESIEKLLPILKIRELDDTITFSVDEPKYLGFLHNKFDNSMDKYIVSSVPCENCAGTGKDPEESPDDFDLDYCVACGGTGEKRTYDFIKYIEEAYKPEIETRKQKRLEREKIEAEQKKIQEQEAAEHRRIAFEEEEKMIEKHRFMMDFENRFAAIGDSEYDKLKKHLYENSNLDDYNKALHLSLLYTLLDIEEKSGLSANEAIIKILKRIIDNNLALS